MKIPLVLVCCLLPYATIAVYDESSTRKINLEDIEDEHVQNERQSQSMPPPLSKQPAKGQPVQLYPPLSNEDYPIPNLYDTHRFATRAHQHAHVQPLTDQPTAPAEAGYQHQQSPAFHGEQIVYLPPPDGQQLQQPPHNPQQLYVVGHQQPQLAPHFYYSHDSPQLQPIGQGNGNVNENEYQLQFVPIDQHGGSAEQQQQQQHSFHGPSSQVTVPSTAAPSVEPVSYSHDGMNYDGKIHQPEIQQHPQQQQPQQIQQQVQQQEPQQQYLILNNAIREPNYAQNAAVYGLPPDVLFQSQKDIEYAKPVQNYGPPPPPPPPMDYFKKEEYSQRDYSQDVSTPKPLTTPEPSYQPAEINYSGQIKSVEYQSQPSQVDSSFSNSQTSYSQNAKEQAPALSYGYENHLGQVSKSIPQLQYYYTNLQNGLKYTPQNAEENKQPATSAESYANLPAPAPSAPTEIQSYYLNHLKEIKSVHRTVSPPRPAITYGPPDTVGKEPQIEYGAPDAPFRRPVAESNQDIYAPRRPPSAGRSYLKSFAVSFPYPPSFVSITTEKTPTTAVDLSASNDVNPWRPMNVKTLPENKYRSFGQTSDATEGHQLLPDYFHTRRAKSLLDSYIPSWLVARMQEEHSRQGQQQDQGQPKQQSYTITSPPAAEDSYNTISYSSNENIYGNHFKRSVPKKKTHQQKKKVVSSNEEMSAME